MTKKREKGKKGEKEERKGKRVRKNAPGYQKDGYCWPSKCILRYM